MKTLIAVAIAGAFALPFAAQASADGDRIIVAQAGGSGGAGGAAGGAAGAPGGAAAQGGAATGASGSGPAEGGSGPRPTTQPDMGSLDKNSDGYVSREEAAGHASMNTRFSELDKDSDGRISREEWNAGTGSAATGATSVTPPTSVPPSTTVTPSDPAKAKGENPGVTR